MMVTVLAFIIVIGVLIFIHEFGHFIVAKHTGVEVEKFSLGFGPKIVGFKRGETHYMISALPLGGYVKMRGENPDEPLSNNPKEFGSRSVGVRSAIVIAGPLMNYLIAFVLMPIVFIVGIQVPAYLDEQPVVQWVSENSPAMDAGFQRGDRIMTINGREVKNWKMINTFLQSHLGKTVVITFVRDGKIQEKSLMLSSDTMALGGLGFMYDMDATVGMVIDNSPAQKEGLKTGDTIKKIGEIPIIHWSQMSEVIRAYPGIEIPLTIERDGKEITLYLTPSAVIDVVDIAGLKPGDIVQAVNRESTDQWRETLLTGLLPENDTLSIEVLRDGKPLTVDIISTETSRVGMRAVGESSSTPGYSL